MSTVITFRDVRKEYQGRRIASSLREVVTGAARALSGRHAREQAVHAVDGITFDIDHGESVGLIGPNGAGKSTLLKLVTRITYPTSGEIGVRGRVGALLDVSSGLHPELSGRENVDLYGRILGLRRDFIVQRFDEIVDFAGLRDAIDQPVKHYSSGMQLRLGFSVAAFLEPDILIVDEALAVGDAAFQARCAERMSDLVHSGKTLIVVSHDTAAIETLCTRCLWLESGRVVQDGPPTAVVAAYLARVHREVAAAHDEVAALAESPLSVTAVTLHDDSGHERTTFRTGEALRVRLHYRALGTVASPLITLALGDGHVGWFAVASMLQDGSQIAEVTGSGHVECRFETLPLNPQAYEVWGEIRAASGFGHLVDWQRMKRFVVDGDVSGPGRASASAAVFTPIIMPHTWTHDGRTRMSGRTGASPVYSSESIT